jgi:lia operon protein LiaG
MKTIKFTVAAIALLFSTSLLKAQDYKVPIENTKDSKVSFENFTGDLPVEGYDGNEIVVTIQSDKFTKAPDKAKGLKPVFAGGEDNTGIGVYMEKNGNNVTLTCLLSITQRENYKIKVPRNIAVKIHSSCGGGGDITVSNMVGEVEVSNCQGIELKNCTGPVVLSTISGSINLKLGSMSKDRPVSIACISGDIDITLAPTAAVDLQMHTVSGNIYTDFDLSQKDKGDLKRVGGNSNIGTQLNGGGAKLTLTNVSGNIYLRKGGV